MNRNYVIVTLFLLWLLCFTLQTYRRWRIQSCLCRTVEMPAHIQSLGGKAELQMLETPQMISTWKHMNISEKCCHSHTCTHIRLTALFRGYLGEPVPEGNTNLDFTEARDSEWQWHQLGHMQVCTSLQTDNHASTPPLSFLQAGCPSCCTVNSVKALKASTDDVQKYGNIRQSMCDGLQTASNCITHQYQRQCDHSLDRCP